MPPAEQGGHLERVIPHLPAAVATAAAGGVSLFQLAALGDALPAAAGGSSPIVAAKTRT
jgi:hypothetical protein